MTAKMPKLFSPMITRVSLRSAKTAKTGYGSTMAAALPLPYLFRYGSGSAGRDFDTQHDHALHLHIGHNPK